MVDRNLTFQQVLVSGLSQKHMSDEEFCKEIGINLVTLNNWRSGKHRYIRNGKPIITKPNGKRISKTLEVPMTIIESVVEFKNLKRKKHITNNPWWIMVALILGTLFGGLVINLYQMF